MGSNKRSDAESLAEQLTERVAGQAELRLHLKAGFQERMEQAAPSSEEITAACTRLEPGKRRRQGARWLWVAWGILGIAWLVAKGIQADRSLLRFHQGIFVQYSKWWRYLEKPATRRFEAFQKEDGPVLMDEDHRPEALLRIDRMRSRSPDDPSIYGLWIYLNCYLEKKPLPDDYDATWQRIDPGNGDWPMLKAKVLSAQALTRVKKKLTITDFSAYAKVTAAIEEARRQPRLNLFEQRHVALTIAGLRHPQSWEEAVTMGELVRPGYSIGSPSALFYAEFQRLSATGDREGMARVAGQILRYHADEALAGNVMPASQVAFREEGLLEETKRARRLNATLGNGTTSDAPVGNGKPAIERARDLRQFRLLLMVIGGGVLGVSALLALRFLPPRELANQASLCAAQLLKRGAALRVMFYGVGLPLVGLIACQALLPEDSPHRDLSRDDGWILICWGWAAAALLLASVVKELTGGLAVIGYVFPWRTWASRTFIFLPFLMLGLAYAAPDNSVRFVAFKALPVLAIMPSIFLLLWLLVAPLLAAMSRWSADLWDRIAIRLIQPSLIVLAALVMASVGFLFHAEKEALAGDPTPYLLSAASSTASGDPKPVLTPAGREAIQRLIADWDAADGR